jgi:hypothetical protein
MGATSFGAGARSLEDEMSLILRRMSSVRCSQVVRLANDMARYENREPRSSWASEARWSTRRTEDGERERTPGNKYFNKCLILISCEVCCTSIDGRGFDKIANITEISGKSSVPKIVKIVERDGLRAGQPG